MRRSHEGRGRARNRCPRRAMITIVVLVCLLVVTLIGAGLLRIVSSERNVVQAEERSLQADWLAESGLERAAARLALDPEYRGETWSIPADVLGGPAPGVVSIKVESHREGKGRRLVTVQADYPSQSDRRVRSSKQSVVDLATGGTGATP